MGTLDILFQAQSGRVGIQIQSSAKQEHVQVVTFYIPLLPVPFQLENIHPKTLQIGDCGSGQPVGHKYSSPRSKKSPRPVRKRIEAWAQKLFMPALCLRILPIVFFASTFQFQRFPVNFSQSPPEQITCSRLLFVHGYWLFMIIATRLTGTRWPLPRVVLQRRR